VLSGFFFYTMEKRSRECNVFRSGKLDKFVGEEFIFVGGKGLGWICFFGCWFWICRAVPNLNQVLRVNLPY